jgi:SulP family sulfate permease
VIVAPPRLADVIDRLRSNAPDTQTLRGEVTVGVSKAVGSVPDGMAGSVLAGVNPMQGLYASVAGPILGGLFASTSLMIVTTTSASAIAAGESLTAVPLGSREAALVLVTLVAGLVAIAAGALRLGRFVSFVSHSVMVGFLTGIAVNIVLAQIPTITGFPTTESGRVAQALDVVVHPLQVDPASLIAGISTMALAIILPRTPLASFGVLVALVVPSAIVALLGLDQVQIVSDIGAITGGIPELSIPSLALLSIDLITTGMAVAVIVLVQGAGVAQTVPNPGGRRSSVSRDFVAQGVANIGSAFLRGLPVGGSVNQTALNVMAGARTRWASVLSGLWMIVILVVFPGLIGYVAMPALAGLLIIAGYRTIDLPEAQSIWLTGWGPRIAVVATFLTTLFLPIQAAVAIGAALTALLFLNESAQDIRIVQMLELDDGRFAEHEPPERLPDEQVTILGVYGSLFYAGARTLERALPATTGSVRPVVVLRLRGRTRVGSTLIDVLDSYSRSLTAVGGRLYISGATLDVEAQLQTTGKLDLEGPVTVVRATSIIGESSQHAAAEGRAWLIESAAESKGSSGPA